MIQGEKNVSTYMMNPQTKVTIKTEKKDDEVFVHKVVIEHEKLSTAPLMFNNKNEIKRLVEGIELDDPQLGMFPNG